MELKTKFKFYSVPEEMNYLGAYRMGSLTEDNEAKLFLNMDAIFRIADSDEIKDKADFIKDEVLRTCTHEFAHSMQEWLNKEYSENEVERVLAEYKKEWESDVTEDTEYQGSTIKVYELLDWLDDLPKDKDVREALNELFYAENNWRKAQQELNLNNNEI